MSTKINLSLDQGSTFSLTFTVNDVSGAPVNLTGYTSRSQFRREYTSSNSYSFTSEITAANTGQVALSMNANSTANVAFGRYVYDVEVIDSEGIVTRVIEGLLTVTPEVTR